MRTGTEGLIDIELSDGRDVIAPSRSMESLVRYRHFIRFGLMSGAIVTDVLALVVAGLIGASLRPGGAAEISWEQSVALLTPTYMLAAITLGAYHMQTLRSIGRSILTSAAALGLAVAVGLCVAFALQVGSQLSRLESGYTVLIAAALMAATRTCGVLLLRRPLRFAIDPTIMVLTDGRSTARRGGKISSMTSVVDVRTAGLVASLSDPTFFDRVGRLVRNADRVVISFGDQVEALKWAEAMRMSGIDAELVADLGDIEPLSLSRWQDKPTLVISRGPLDLSERIVKRTFDLVVTLALMPVVGPVIALFAILVKLESPGSAFFVQDRVGRNNRTYRCFKLRTMRNDLLDSAGAVSTSRTDARVTKIGGFLRKTSIDELPQLLNVLLGDMSLVGPRPHALGSRAEGALFWELVPDYWSRHAMKPGVTGLAQVRGFRGTTHVRADIEKRVAADLEYINAWSIWLDIKILFLTFSVMVHKNAY